MIFEPNVIVNVVESTDPAIYQTHLPPPMTHFIGQFRYPLITSQYSSVFTAHHLEDREQFSGPVNKLTFLHMGNPETPSVLAYSRTCKSIEFSGHISSTNAAFEIISQLPVLKKVTFFIGPAQSHYFSEAMKQLEVCKSVKKLQIIMNLEFFYSFQHLDCGSENVAECVSGRCLSSFQYTLIHLVELILGHAKEAFPNLKSLVVELPDNERLCNAVQGLIQACRGLRKKTLAEVQPVVSENPQNQSVKPRAYRRNHQQVVSSFDNTGSNGMYQLHCQQSYSSSEQEPVLNESVTYNAQFENGSALSKVENIGGRPGLSNVKPEVPLEQQQEDLYQRVSNWLSNLEV